MLKQIDHTTYPARLRKKTEESLHALIKDATEAIQANPDNPNNGYYWHEIHYARAELNRRSSKK